MDRLLRATAKWELLPGPQTSAADTEAFETLYGGEAGGGKTELIAWLAKHRQHHSLVLRRSFPELERTLIPRMLEKYGQQKFYNQTQHIWRFPDGKRIELGYLDNDKDVFKYQGAEIDGFFPDELTQFPRDWYLYLFSRIRSTRPGQRKRVVATTNPGGENEAWVKQRWAPWLDKKHPKPAKSGEIRWYHRAESGSDYAEEEIDATHPDVTSGSAWSRTFIRAGVRDNVYIDRDYLRNLDMLPEPYRSQLKKGDWEIGSSDHDWQVIPTAWVEAAQARWTEKRPDVPMSQLGIDVARGGKDSTVIIPRYANWFAEPLKYPGTATPDGFTIVMHVSTLAEHEHAVPDGVPVAIDIIGVGSSPADILTANNFNVVPMNGAEASDATDKTGHLRFANKRAEWWWKLREALDPNSGEQLALPPGGEVLADLTSPRWSMKARGVQLEDKDDIRDRLGRSPDVGDTIVYAHAQNYPAGWNVIGFYNTLAKKAKEA